MASNELTSNRVCQLLSLPGSDSALGIFPASEICDTDLSFLASDHPMLIYGWRDCEPHSRLLAALTRGGSTRVACISREDTCLRWSSESSCLAPELVNFALSMVH